MGELLFNLEKEFCYVELVVAAISGKVTIYIFDGKVEKPMFNPKKTVQLQVTADNKTIPIIQGVGLNWFRQFRTISSNSLKVSTSEPLFLILHLSTLFIMLILGVLPGFTYGEDTRFLRDQCLALIYIAGCTAFVFGLIRTVTGDIREGTGAILMGQSVSPTCILLGKWTGVFLSVLLFITSLSISYLWVAEFNLSSGTTEHLNSSSVVLYGVSLVIATLIGGLCHYLIRDNFMYRTNFIVLGVLLIFFLVRWALIGGKFYDWCSLQGILLLVFGIVSFSAALLPFSVLFNSSLVLVSSIILFFLGLISEYLTTSLTAGSNLNFIRAIVPNWQIFWASDRLNNGSGIPLSYIAVSSLKVLFFFIPATMLSAAFLKRSEING